MSCSATKKVKRLQRFTVYHVNSKTHDCSKPILYLGLLNQRQAEEIGRGWRAGWQFLRLYESATTVPLIIVHPSTNGLWPSPLTTGSYAARRKKLMDSIHIPDDDV